MLLFALVATSSCERNCTSCDASPTVPVNQTPVATELTVTVAEDSSVNITLAGTDADGTIMDHAVATSPDNGTLTGTAPNLQYTPDADFNGADSFTFTVTDDAGAVSAPARVSIEVTPVNDAPVAMSQSVAVDEDGAVAIVLAGSDVDGDVAYQITGAPRHGTLGGDAPSLIYMPEVDYNGPDSFTFTVTDDAGAVSAPARVSIEVTPVNDAPVAMSQSVAVDEDGAVAIVLAGSDVDGDIVAYQVTDPPRHGTLGGDAPSLTYMPEVDYNGPDSFTFTVTDDAGAVSAPARVSIEVTPVNDAPVAMSQSVAVDEDGAVAIVLAGSDVDGDIVAYQVTDPPRHGTLGGDAPSLTYMPEVDYNGPDSFTFTVTDDAGAVSAPARVSIEVTPVNDAPVAMSQSVAVDEDGTVAIVLAGSDVDGDIVAYQVTDPPRHGTLGGDAPSLTYMPEVDYNGPDSFTFTVTDGDGTVSTPADVSITVTPVNDAPVAMSQSVAVDEDGAVAIVLAGSDVDGDIVAYQVTDPPRHGTLGGDAPSLTYMPEVDYNGPDSFTFTVTDGDGTVSTPADVSITVTPVNDAPTALAQTVAVASGQAIDIVLEGTDVDGTVDGYEITVAPQHGALSGTAPMLKYTPEAGFTGMDAFTFTVTDDAGAVSAPARVSIEVTPVNDAPVAMSQSVAVDEDGAVAIVLAGSDVDGDIVAYQVTGPPRHGTLGGDAPSLTYMPEVDYNGPDSFTFTVTDDAGAVSAPARVSIEVTPVNDAPVAMSQSVAVDEDGTVAIVLAGSDVDGDIVAYQVTDPPRHGTLGGDAPSLTYMPEVDYNGPDSFTFTVTDGDGTVSTPADVSITVTPVNDAPTALAQTVAVASGQAIDIVLEGTDVDGTVDGYEITVAPQHGALSGTAPMLKYTPEAGFTGMDAFTFTVTDDAGATSGAAEVNIEVTPPDCDGERDVLVAFYQATNGDGWGENNGWLTSDDLANWHGVTAVDGCIVRISLSFNGLVGTIPWQLGSLAFLGRLELRRNDLAGSIPSELGMLTKLEVLDLYDNNLTGTIPWELGNLQSLEELELGWNELSGTIPVELGQLTNIKTLNLSNNELTGGVPVELSSLANIENLYLSANPLTGQIPKELAQLTRLKELVLDSNDLVGPIPPEFGDLPSILQLSLARNHLTGPVPEELGNLSSLLVLSLAANEFTGPIPPELANLRSVERLNLSENRLSGGIPVEFGELASLEWLDLFENELTGPIPPELARLTNLVWLSLHTNQLAGPIPAVLGTMHLRYLDLSHNQLTGSIPEELGELSSLAYLSLADNSLTGTIPLSLGQLPMDPSLVNGVRIGRGVHRGLRSGLLLSGNELSGPVPVELGNLTSAQILLLDRNRLTGPLPAELTGLTALIKFWFNENNGLCAPADTGFQDWLRGIQDMQGPTCQ